jgi:nitrogenase molybdenum-iron protein alpha/beta subunit
MRRRCWPRSTPRAPARAPWYARSVDSTYLTGKRVFVFGDATHAVAAARVAAQELGFQVVGLGTYSREFAREVREAAKLYGVEPLITDDYLEVEARHRRAAARAGAGHADGTPHRQAPEACPAP